MVRAFLLACAVSFFIGVRLTAPASPTFVSQITEQIVVPESSVERAKFAKEDPRVVDALAFVNALVNQSIQPVEDQEQYGVPEMWVMFPASGKGDCEDYALTKLGVLSNSGFPAVTNARVRGVVVTASDGNMYGHAILEVRLPNGSIAFMDNRFPMLMTRQELVAEGYKFYDW